MIGARRPRVNQLLGFYEDRGAIARRGRQIVILKPELLQRWASPWGQGRQGPVERISRNPSRPTPLYSISSRRLSSPARIPSTTPTRT